MNNEEYKDTRKHSIVLHENRVCFAECKTRSNLVGWGFWLREIHQPIFEKGEFRGLIGNKFTCVTSYKEVILIENGFDWENYTYSEDWIYLIKKVADNYFNRDTMTHETFKD